jgi:hypothetical protein
VAVIVFMPAGIVGTLSKRFGDRAKTRAVLISAVRTEAGK